MITPKDRVNVMTVYASDKAVELVKAAYAKHPEATDREIAELVGFGAGYVGAIRSKYLGVKKATGKPGKLSICWRCARAGGGMGCPFVDGFPSGETPVEGWAADRVTRQMDYGRHPRFAEQYVVKECPLFAEDGSVEYEGPDLAGVSDKLRHFCRLCWNDKVQRWR